MTNNKRDSNKVKIRLIWTGILSGLGTLLGTLLVQSDAPFWWDELMSFRSQNPSSSTPALESPKINQESNDETTPPAPDAGAQSSESLQEFIEGAETLSGNRNSKEFSVSPFDSGIAIELIEQWLGVKDRVFGPPYDKDILPDYLTGELLKDLQNSDWLEKNGYRYSFNRFLIEEDWGFDKFGDTRAVILVKILEDRILYDNKGEKYYKNDATGIFTKVYRYRFEFDGNAWKISNHCTCQDDDCNVCKE